MPSSPFVSSGKPLTAAEMQPPESPLDHAREHLRAKSRRVDALAADLAQRQRAFARAGSPPEQAPQIRQAQLALENANTAAQAAREEVERLQVVEAEEATRRKDASVAQLVRHIEATGAAVPRDIEDEAIELYDRLVALDARLHQKNAQLNRSCEQLLEQIAAQGIDRRTFLEKHPGLIPFFEPFMVAARPRSFLLLRNALRTALARRLTAAGEVTNGEAHLLVAPLAGN